MEMDRLLRSTQAEAVARRQELELRLMTKEEELKRKLKEIDQLSEKLDKSEQQVCTIYFKIVETHSTCIYIYIHVEC